MKLDEFEDSTKLRLLDLDKSEFIDSTYVVSGYAEFKGDLKEPFTARIQTDYEILILWVENGLIKVEGDRENFLYSKISGGSLNEVMTKNRDHQRALNEQVQELTNEGIQLMDSDTQASGRKFDEASELYDKISNIRKNVIVVEEPSYYTMKELYFLRNDFEKDSLKMLFNRFPEVYQKTSYGEIVSAYIDNEIVEIGDTYIDIEGLDGTGQRIKLSTLEGKYVLLDFWASWCGPCRMENPKLVKMYNKYKARGFEIYGFSIDKDINAWKQAVKADSLKWTNVIDTTASYSKMAALYRVQGIPTSFIINQEGKIIAKNLRGSRLERTLEELFGKD